MNASPYKSNVRIFVAVIIVFLTNFLLPATVLAEQAQTFGDYTVHYNAYVSTFLSSDVAKIYGIERDKNRGVVLISVNRKDTVGVGVDAQVRGAAKNLVQQMQALEFATIKEGKAIYYISTFGFDHQENLNFNVDVTIAPTATTHQIKWSQKFWRD